MRGKPRVIALRSTVEHENVYIPKYSIAYSARAGPLRYGQTSCQGERGPPQSTIPENRYDCLACYHATLHGRLFNALMLTIVEVSIVEVSAMLNLSRLEISRPVNTSLNRIQTVYRHLDFVNFRYIGLPIL